MDRAASAHPLPEAVRSIFAAGADWLQIRERELKGRELLDFASELADAARDGAKAAGRCARILVNKRIDIALALDADGVHLGFDAVAIRDARAALGPDAFVGVSTHRATEVRDAANAGANYAQLAPIFAPLSKASTRPSLGLETLTNASVHGIPVLAQGGIAQENSGDVIRAGAAGVCVTGALLQASDPEHATRALRAALDAAAG